MKFKKNRADAPTTVFKFGCKLTGDSEPGLNSFKLMNQCYNNVIEIRRETRDAYYKLLQDAEPRLGELSAQIDALYESRNVLRDQIRDLKVAAQSRNVTDRGVTDQIEAIEAEINILKVRRTAIFDQTKTAFKTETKALYDTKKTKIKETKQKYSGFGCNGLAVDAIIEEASRAKKLKFRPFRDGKAKLVKRFNTGKPLTVQQVLDGKWPQLRITNSTAKHNTKGRWLHNKLDIDFNIGDGRKYKYIRLCVTQHRLLPPDALLVRAVLKTRRRGHKLKYELHLTLEHPSAFTKPVIGTGTVSLDFNYRRFNGGLEWVTWVGDDGRHGHVNVDSTVVAARQKVDYLQSIRDTMFNNVRAEIATWDKTLLPAEIRESIKHVHAWKSHRRLLQLYWQWGQSRFVGDDSMFSTIREWVTDERHLEDFQRGLHNRLNAARLAFQRNFAADLRKKGYATVLGDGIGLKKLSAKKPVEFADDSWDSIRWNKNLAAHSDTTKSVKQSGTYIKADCKNSSRRCTECNELGPKSKERMLTCKCGLTQHRDIRGALNPLQDHLGRGVKLVGDPVISVFQFREHRKNMEAHRENYFENHPEARFKVALHDARRDKQREQRDARRLEKAAKRPPRKAA